MATTAVESQLPPVHVDPLVAEPEGQWTIVFRRFRRHRLAMTFLIVLLLIFAGSILAPILAPFERDEVNVSLRFANVFTTDPKDGRLHVLGTDHIGRDFFTRLLYAARVTLSVAFSVATLSVLMGMTVGAIAGFYRKIVDSILMRVLEFMASVPTFPILLILSSILITQPQLLPIPPFITSIIQTLMLVNPTESRGVFVVIMVLAIFGWTGSARLMRGMVLSIRERDFIESARALGANDVRIIFKHVVPNAFPPLIVAYTLALAGALVAETGLSFLGLGITDPTPTWGNMLDFATRFMLTNPFVPLIPGIPVVLCALAFNFIGDGLRDALDPRLKL